MVDRVQQLKVCQLTINGGKLIYNTQKIKCNTLEDTLRLLQTFHIRGRHLRVFVHPHKFIITCIKIISSQKLTMHLSLKHHETLLPMVVGLNCNYLRRLHKLSVCGDSCYDDDICV